MNETTVWMAITKILGDYNFDAINKNEAKKRIKYYGVENYSYLFNGKIKYIGYGNFQLETI